MEVQAVVPVAGRITQHFLDHLTDAQGKHGLSDDRWKGGSMPGLSSSGTQMPRVVILPFQRFGVGGKKTLDHHQTARTHKDYPGSGRHEVKTPPVWLY
jgi:hypothetical protein